MRLATFVFTLSFLGSLVSAQEVTSAQGVTLDSLRRSLTFAATFDSGTDAEVGGNRLLMTAPSLKQRAVARAGLPANGEVEWSAHEGRFGGCLRFRKSTGPFVFYRAADNLRLPSENWSGTISVWLSTSPEEDLLEGFCDPLQITSKQWDDAAMFVEFEKRASGIPFRLGVYADKDVWNPTGRKFESIPQNERPLVAQERPPFTKGKWTHIAFTFEHFNTNLPNGSAALYLEGKLVGVLKDRTQTFTWNAEQAAIMLGLNYVGRLDELSIFDRALKGEEIEELYRLKSGIGELLRN